MSHLLICLSLFFILLSISGFYYSSKKNHQNINKGILLFFRNHPKTMKLLSGILFFFGLITLSYTYDYSVAFVSIWVLATPIIFVFICAKCDFYSRSKSQNKHQKS